MSATIVYVHGNGNKIRKDLLKAEWDQALFGRDMGPSSRMAYWAPERYPQPATESSWQDSAAAPSGGFETAPHAGDTEAFVSDVLLTAQKERSGGFGAESGGADPLERWLRRMAYTAEALADGAALQSAPVPATEALPLPRRLRTAAFRALVERTFTDVYAYFFADLKEAMQQVLRNELRDVDGPLIVLGHSLGSIIAYDVLRAQNPAVDVDLFVTVGSPLGVTEVQDLLDQPLRVPERVRAWHNASDARDLVALDHTIRPEYEPAERCADYFVTNNSGNHHGIGEYLRAPAVRDPVLSLFQAQSPAASRSSERSTVIPLRSVAKPATPFESAETESVMPEPTPGSPGTATAEVSRSRRLLVAAGKSGPIRPPFESVIGVDERERILDTDLAPWRMICALRLRGPSGAGAIGTGWFIGPRTVLTAGHCVYSTYFFGGWASSITVIPGLNGTGDPAQAKPYGEVTATRFSSTDRWVDKEDPDFDIGCIHLDEPLGEQVGWFALAAVPPDVLAGYLVNVSGYPADRGAGSIQFHARNRVLSVGERRLFYEVDTYGGQSGAPVWIHETEDGPPIAVAVHAYGTSGTPADLDITANSAPRIIPEMLDKLTGWVEQDGGWPA